MPNDHPGFEYWDIDDAAHPFPVSEIEIEIVYDDADFAAASAEFTLPQALPRPATVAERYLGIVGKAQLWFALACTTDLQGNVVCEGVLRGKHLHFHPEHGESEAGPVQEIRLTMAEMRGFGRREALAAHGPHCDLFSVNWSVRQGNVHCELHLLHIRNTVQGFLDARERTMRDAERRPPRVIIDPLPDPDAPLPTPTPKPKPEPLPDGAMKPERPGGGMLALLRRIRRAIFG